MACQAQRLLNMIQRERRGTKYADNELLVQCPLPIFFSGLPGGCRL